MHAESSNPPAFRRGLGQLVRLALPITVGQLAIVGMSVTDIIVSGWAGTNELAAVSLGSTIFNLSIMLVIGIVLANGPLVGQHYGAGRVEALRRQFQNCLWLSLPLGLVGAVFIGVGFWFVPVLDIDAAVAAATRGYLLPMAGTAFLLPFLIAIRTTFESVGQARAAMVFNVAGFLINIPLDFALVLGKWHLPAMGGAGCGWATLGVSTFIVLSQWCYARYSQLLSGLSLLVPFKRFDLSVCKETLRVGLPIGGAILAEGGYFLLIPLFVAHLGAIVVSGHSVAISFDWAMFVVPLGISQAISVLSAHELGRQQPILARRMCFSGIALTAAIALVQAALVVVFRHEIARLFSPDPAVRELAAHLLVYAAGFRVFDAINVAGNGALRSYKDTRITVVLAVTGYWLIGFPLSYTLALTPHLGSPRGVEGFWVGMLITLVVVSCLTTARVAATSRRAISEACTER